MTLLTNTLTFNFARAVQWTNDAQTPQLLEVCVIPLANPSFPDQSTFVGGLQSQQVLLSDTTNSISFNLVPSYAAGLSEPVLYRAEWRQGGITGRTYSQDFAMPAQDIDWDQLNLLGDYVDGTMYVQQSQVGVANGVAALNAAGAVVDATGTALPSQVALTAVSTSVTTEVANRIAAIDALNSTLSNSLAEDINGLSTTVANNLASAVATLNATVTSSYDTLNTAITSEASTRASADTTFTSNIATLTGDITTINTTLGTKADLVGGYLKSTQIPPTLVLNAYPVSGQGGMLALSNSSNNGSLPPVHYADIALWANGAVWMLVGNPSSPVPYPDPTVLSNWVDLTSVYSVNGKQGNVTLVPADIGAVGTAGSYGSVTQTQVTGLSTTLATYTPLSSYNTLNTTVQGILSNTNYVQLDTSGPSSGYINHAKLDASVAYVNSLNEVTLKNGTVIASGTGTILSVNGYEGPNVTLTAADVGAVATGGTIPESAVVGLTADLTARVLSTDSRLSNARTPTAHASTHADGGTDPLTLGQDQITGLTSALAALAPLTTTNNQANQISSLQSSVTYLLGGGSPSSSPIKAIWYDGTSTFSGVTNPADFQNIYNVLQKSPFGLSASTGKYYYNPAGAAAGEWVFPYITKGGHLEFHQWNESNPADTVYATQAALNTLTTTVGTLATQASLATLQNQVNASATQTSVNAINTTIATLASQSSVNSLATQIGNAATQAALNATNATVATLATQSSVNALSASITGLASQSALNTLSATVASHTTSLAAKADLVAGTVPLNEMPENIPQSYISGLTSTLAGLCPLTGGLVPIGNLPNIPESQVTNLTSNLAAKADLVGGLVPTSQLPSLSINNVYVVANQAAMLAESGAHVGDICVITATSAEGTYILASTPASTLSNWVLLPSPQSVTQVNGQTGSVTLTAANVGAMAIGVAIPTGQVTGLDSTISGLATTNALNTAVTGLQSLSQVQSTLTSSSLIKQAANYVASSSIASLAGQQSVDGVLTPLGSIVLATAQPSGINNGLWVVQSGAWTRTTDYATGSYFVRGTVVFVKSGASLANTIWQETATSGVVDSNSSSWANIMTAGGPITYTNGNGISLSSNTFSLNPVSGGGIAVSSAGVAIDPGVVARKAVGYVPNGSTVATITHNLNTMDLGAVYIREMSSNNQVLACATATGPNTCTIEFGNPPGINQYRYTVIA